MVSIEIRSRDAGLGHLGPVLLLGFIRLQPIEVAAENAHQISILLELRGVESLNEAQQVNEHVLKEMQTVL
jgi:hypothetical protein